MNSFRFSLSFIGLALVVTLLSKEPSAFGAGDSDRVAVLESRIASLEKVIRNLDRTPELTSLKSRIADLERTQRESRNTISSGSSRTSSRDLSQVTRTSASLKNAVTRLEAKVSSGEQTATQMQREISRLKLNVSSLQSAIDRLRQ